MAELDAKENEPVTAFISRTVREDSQEAYDRWVEQVTEVIKEFPGFLGSKVLKPGRGHGLGGRHVMELSFDSISHLLAWEDSPVRQQWLLRLQPLVDGSDSVRHVSNVEEPVTVVISRRVKEGKEEAYEEWLKVVTRKAQQFQGHTGAQVLKPKETGDGRYAVVFRFDSYENLMLWEESPERAKCIEDIADLVEEGDEDVQRVNGLEFLFELSQGPVAAGPPNRHKMALTLVCVITVLVILVQNFLGPYIADLPLYMRAVIIAVLQVFLMTYIIMPQVTKLLRGWLFDSKA